MAKICMTLTNIRRRLCIIKIITFLGCRKIAYIHFSSVKCIYRTHSIERVMTFVNFGTNFYSLFYRIPWKIKFIGTNFLGVITPSLFSNSLNQQTVSLRCYNLSMCRVTVYYIYIFVILLEYMSRFLVGKLVGFVIDIWNRQFIDINWV